METVQERILRLQSELEMMQITLIARYGRVKGFFTTEMNTFMTELVGKRWKFSEINELVIEIEDESKIVEEIERKFGIFFNTREFGAVRRYIDIYIYVLYTEYQLEKALKRD